MADWNDVHILKWELIWNRFVTGAKKCKDIKAV